MSDRMKVKNREGGSILPHPGGASLFRLLLLSVTRLHTEFRVTRAMSNVMLKFRRYHSLRVRQENKICLSIFVDSLTHLLYLACRVLFLSRKVL